MQIIVTSYRRLKYLKQTVESLRQDDVELIIVDDGSNDPELEEYIRKNADTAIICNKNKGADFSKNVGLVHITDKTFMITSDDLVYPKGYSKALIDQYNKLNENGLRYMFMACNMVSVEKVIKNKWFNDNGVEVYCVCKSQVAGAVFNTELLKKIGGWPIYGKSGAGDRALSFKLRGLGYRIGYFRSPIIKHIGVNKHKDFPEYSENFMKDHIAVAPIANVNGLNR
jgi:glycosyltransferase involved in cell wall biosynthesis